MKRSSAVASVCLAVAMLSSCDTNKDVDGGISSVTYTTDNTIAPSVVTGPKTQIELSKATKNNVTWSCPPGYVVPTKLINSTPRDGNPTTIAYNGTRQIVLIMRISFRAINSEWNMYEDLEIMPGKYNMVQINNNNMGMISIVCTKIGTQDNWI